MMMKMMIEKEIKVQGTKRKTNNILELNKAQIHLSYWKLQRTVNGATGNHGQALHVFMSNSIRLYLGFDSKKTTAVLGPAVARCPSITQTVQVVIKGQFRV